MKLSKLLSTRQSIQRQAHLASLAHAYFVLRRLADRIATARLRGLVRLQPADPHAERYWATLTALEGSQSVIEEHFSDHELMELADALQLAVDGELAELDFSLEELGEKYIAPLRRTLDQSGVEIDFDDPAPPLV